MNKTSKAIKKLAEAIIDSKEINELSPQPEAPKEENGIKLTKNEDYKDKPKKIAKKILIGLSGDFESVNGDIKGKIDIIGNIDKGKAKKVLKKIVKKLKKDEDFLGWSDDQTNKLIESLKQKVESLCEQ